MGVALVGRASVSVRMYMRRCRHIEILSCRMVCCTWSRGVQGVSYSDMWAAWRKGGLKAETAAEVLMGASDSDASSNLQSFGEA